MKRRIDHRRHRRHVERAIEEFAEVVGHGVRIPDGIRVPDHETRDLAILNQAMDLLQLLFEDRGQVSLFELGT